MAIDNPHCRNCSNISNLQVSIASLSPVVSAESDSHVNYVALCSIEDPLKEINYSPRSNMIKGLNDNRINISGIISSSSAPKNMHAGVDERGLPSPAAAVDATDHDKSSGKTYGLRNAVVSKEMLQDPQKQAMEDDIPTRDASCREEGSALNLVGNAMAGPSLIGAPMITLPYHKILELDVSKMEEQIFHLKIHCKKTPGVLVQLTRTLEALDLYEITRATLTGVSGHIFSTIVVKSKEEVDVLLEREQLKDMLLEIASKFGLFCLM